MKNKLYSTINPSILFFSSILCLPTAFFQTNLLFLWITVLLFIILLRIKKGKIKLLPSMLLCVFIIVFNLLTPSGKVYITLGDFRITHGALTFALQKSGVLLAMVYISQYAISRNLSIRGSIGYFINSMFFYFDKLTEHKTAFNIKSAVTSIDAILVEVYKSDVLLEADATKQAKQGKLAWVVCIIPILITYCLLVVGIML